MTAVRWMNSDGPILDRVPTSGYSGSSQSHQNSRPENWEGMALTCQADKKLARHNDYIPWFTPLVIKTAAFRFGNNVLSVVSQLHGQYSYNLRL